MFPSGDLHSPVYVLKEYMPPKEAQRRTENLSEHLEEIALKMDTAIEIVRPGLYRLEAQSRG